MGSIVALGIIYLIVRFIALGSVAMATAASVLVVGVMNIAAGITEVISAPLRVENWSASCFESCFILNRALLRFRRG